MQIIIMFLRAGLMKVVTNTSAEGGQIDFGTSGLVGLARLLFEFLEIDL